MPELSFPDPPLTDGVIALRPWTEADVPDISACCQDEEIQRWTQVPSPYDDHHARTFVNLAEEWKRSGQRLCMAVTDGETGELVGAVDVRPKDIDRSADIGYWVAAPARGRGTAPRAVRLLSDWAFEVLGVERVKVATHPENKASQRVALKAGFTREGLVPDYELARGGWEDRVIFSLRR
jgi:RimJ/RimL family protein N-acetyltransferase